MAERVPPRGKGAGGKRMRGEAVMGMVLHVDKGWVPHPSMFAGGLCAARQGRRDCACAGRNCREVRIRMAIEACLKFRLSLREAERVWGIPRSTLQQRVKRWKQDKASIHFILNED